MIDYYLEQRAAGHDDFEILAFHDASVKSLAELDKRLVEKKIRAKRWKGRHLPFPVLLDATGETIAKFGIQAYPTTILVDPTGKLVGERRLDALEAALTKQRAAAEAAGRRKTKRGH